MKSQLDKLRCHINTITVQVQRLGLIKQELQILVTITWRRERQETAAVTGLRALQETVIHKLVNPLKKYAGNSLSIGDIARPESKWWDMPLGWPRYQNSTPDRSTAFIYCKQQFFSTKCSDFWWYVSKLMVLYNSWYFWPRNAGVTHGSVLSPQTLTLSWYLPVPHL